MVKLFFLRWRGINICQARCGDDWTGAGVSEAGFSLRYEINAPLRVPPTPGLRARVLVSRLVPLGFRVLAYGDLRYGEPPRAAGIQGVGLWGLATPLLAWHTPRGSVAELYQRGGCCVPGLGIY